MNSHYSSETKPSPLKKNDSSQPYDEEKAYLKIKEILESESFYILPKIEDLKLINEYLKFGNDILSLPGISKYAHSSHYKMLSTAFKYFFEEIDAALTECLQHKKTFSMDPILVKNGWKKEMLSWGISEIHHSVSTNKPDQKTLKKKFTEDDQKKLINEVEQLVPGVSDFLNNALGEKFKANIVATKKGTWITYSETCGNYTAKLQGNSCYIKSQSDCIWFKNKLKKAGILEEDIHFDIIPQTETTFYQLRISNVQKISDPKCEDGCTCHPRKTMFTW